MPRPKGRGWTIAGFVLAALALLLGALAIFLGPTAVALGIVGLRKGDPLGKKAALAGVAGMVAGIFLQALLVGSDPT